MKKQLVEKFIEIKEDWEKGPEEARKIIFELADLLFTTMQTHQHEIDSLKKLNENYEDSKEYNRDLGKIHAYRTTYECLLKLTNLNHECFVKAFNRYQIKSLSDIR